MGQLSKCIMREHINGERNMDKLKELLNKIFPSIPFDKKLHFITGFIICIFFSIINDPITGIGAAICCGIAKECYDDYIYGGFDWKEISLISISI